MYSEGNKRNYPIGLLWLKKLSKEHQPLVISTYQIDDCHESWIPMSHPPNKSVLSLSPGKVTEGFPWSFAKSLL